MENATTIALSRLVAQTRATDVIANNFANAATPGFKAERSVFADWLDKQLDTKAPAGGRTLIYTQDRATYREQSEGAMQQTGNPFDLAISGAGFFTVETARGPRLTRAGRFQPGTDGTIQDAEGDALLDTNGRPIQIAASDTGITIAGDGTVSSANGQISRIGIVTAADPNAMQAEGDHLFTAGSDTSPVTAPTINQGMLEGSNVQPVLEMTRMMATSREFEFVSEFVKAEADRQQSVIDRMTDVAG